jgi:hypothetical protein
MLLAIAVVLGLAATACRAEQYYCEPSNRARINLGENPWKFTKGDPANAQSQALADSSWSTVGIPHTWSDTESFNNQMGGGATGSMYGGVAWYRKHFSLDSMYLGRKVFVEFEGAHLGAAVYINGTFLPGNDGINANATHVVGFIGFVVDITPYVKFGWGTDNVLAVKMSGNGGFFTYPGFSIDYRFGQGDYGLFRPVWIHITDKVHVPLNVYSVVNQWGTYVATVSASDASALVKIQTNVRNDNAAAQTVTLTTKVVDMYSTVVATMETTQTVGADTNAVFDQNVTIANPHLWYPAGSTFGKPYLYTVYHIVRLGGTTVDVFQSPLGIRTITWDKNFPYINGHQHYMWGVSSRYDYPALGTAVPEEQQWRDAKLAADCSANMWRPGHSSSSPEFVHACDAYGVMLVQPSGELEGTFSTAQLNATKATYKTELHRDMIIRDRNDPSILAWEVSNGPIDPTFAAQLKALSKTWDPVNTRAQSDRGGSAADPAIADLISCSSSGCEISMKNSLPNTPCWGAEAWGGKRSARYAYDYELAFAGEYVQNWKKARQANCFGLAHWYLCETPGESGAFLEGVAEGGVRSFGSSMMDFNRIPKLLYKIYQAAWTPFTVKPVVSLAHHWNRAGNVRVNAFSNCPSVRLLINGASQGTKTPNPWTGAGDGTDQNTTQLPYQCYWDVTWAPGTLRAEGLDASGTTVCFDEKKTADVPDHIVLTCEPPLVRPNGATFQITANGTDAAFILATVVDKNGIWCPTANNLVTFSVSGPGDYRGGSDQLVTAGKPLGYHSPLDHELSAEGGMCKVAVRSKFTTGTVTVTAASPGLGQGTVSYTVNPLVPCACPVQLRQPMLAASAVTPTFRIGFSGGTLRYLMSKTAIVSVDVINASGRVIMRVPGSLQTAGWHSIGFAGTKTREDAARTAVYFVRFTVNGGYQCVKRLLAVR